MIYARLINETPISAIDQCNTVCSDFSVYEPHVSWNHAWRFIACMVFLVSVAPSESGNGEGRKKDKRPKGDNARRAYYV